MKLIDSFQTLEKQEILILLLLNQRMFNPLIPKQFQLLQEKGVLKNTILEEVITCLEETISELSPGTYFPAPIAREMEKGTAFSLDLAAKFSIPFIRVDKRQNWYSQEKTLDQRIKKFFISNLFYEAALQRYFVEYQVDSRMDKCYLKCEITPMLGLQINQNANASWEIQLNNDKTDTLDPTSFFLDKDEQLFCKTKNHGFVLLDENPRYEILKGIQENGLSLILDGKFYPLNIRE